ncbi:SET domain-containing protein [Byssothecium circinans]|uniref:SET domain-containing protein n=1 Tax=Byssothecium circinans TaxID=147558 RepID=A0A6A5TVP1_9PLEO|nr:SET domain-containing protein [Byssothecium circinans]
MQSNRNSQVDKQVPDHPYHHLNIPDNAPFTLKASPGKGWGAFATKNIPKGSTILIEKPFFHIQKHHDFITEHDLRRAFQQLSPASKAQFSLLRDNASVYFTSMEGAFSENSFATTDPPGHGLYLLHSRFNHSCLPNAGVPIHKGTAMTSYAFSDILKGEEITICYNTDFGCRTREDRHLQLRFVCNCKACLPGTPFQTLSDMRRMLIRGLQYLLHGTDLDECVSSIIFDAELKRNAEAFNIPLSARLIYRLLTMVLLENEGLLDDFTVKRMEPGILPLALSFQTTSNLELAVLAVAQQRWIEKLCAALKLWGRKDEADRAVAIRLKISRGLPPL